MRCSLYDITYPYLIILLFNGQVFSMLAPFYVCVSIYKKSVQARDSIEHFLTFYPSDTGEKRKHNGTIQQLFMDFKKVNDSVRKEVFSIF
jgi:hypothetical protein